MRQKHFRKMFALLAIASFGISLSAYAQNEAETQEEQDSGTLNLDYRTISTSDYNGSIYTVKAEDLLTTATTFITENLMGIIPGMMFRQSQGDLGSGSGSYWVRGIRTFNAGVLVLVDGTERNLADLSLEEIESITILKDATAIGIYGMRAANGAVYVRTKHGVAGKPKVNFQAQVIRQAPTSIYDAADAATYAHHYNIAQRFDGVDPSYSLYDIDRYRNPDGVEYADVDWMDKYFKKSWWLQKYSVNVSGGMKNATYFVDFGYVHQPGMYNTEGDLGYNTNNNSDRYNYRSNISVDVTSTTHLDVDIYGWYKSQFMPKDDETTLFTLLNNTPANSFPEYYIYKDGYIDQSGAAITPMAGKMVAGNTYNTNPWAYLNRSGYSHAMTMYGSLNAVLTQDLSFITDGLYARAKMSFDSKTVSTATRTRGFAYYYPLAEEGTYQITGNDGNLSNTVTGKNGHRLLTINGTLGYEHSFGKNNISAAATYEQYENTANTGVPTRIQGGYAYASWNYDHRFGVDLTGTYQGWYGFAPGHKFGFFPTVAAGWTLSNEEFLKDVDAIDYLKVRASFGKIGSFRGIEAFTYLGYLSNDAGIATVGKTANQNLAGYYEAQIANAALTWEKSKMLNIGLDGRFFSDRLTLTADYWRDDRTDIYAANNRVSTLIGLNGSTAVNSNIAAMTSAGYEIGAGWKDRIGDFGYSLNGTLTYSSNVVNANGDANEIYSYLSDVNYPYGRKLGYVAEGIFQSYEEIAGHATQSWSALKPGDIAYKDINGDGVINSNDRVPIGYNNTPEYYYGIQLGLSWKTWGLSVLFQGAAHVTHAMNTADYEPFVSYGTIYQHELNYWTPENPTAKFPRTTLGTSASNNTVNSTLFMSDSDYLRLKRVELTYSLPQNVVNASRILSGATFFLSGYNLLTWSDYPYGDPEYAVGLGNMPVNRNISLGCRVSF